MTATVLHPAREAHPHRPAGERAAVFAVFLALGICTGAWAAALPALKDGLRLSDRQIGLALLCLAVGSVLSTVMTGAMARHLGTRGATRIGLVAMVAVLLLPPLAGSLPQLCAATLAFGVAIGLLDVSMNGHAGALEERWEAPLMSSFHGAFSLGGLGGAALGGTLAALGAGALGQLAVASALTAAIAAVSLPRLGPGAPTGAGGGTVLAWPSRKLVGLCAIAAACFIVEGAMGDWSAIYLDTVTGSGLAVAAAGYAAFSVAMAAVRFAGDRGVAALGASAVLVGGGALACAGLALAVLVPVPLAAAAGFALVGLGLGNVVPVAFSAAARSGATPAAGIAPVATLGYAGFLLGPPIIGSLSGAAGLRLALGCLILATAVVALVGAQVSGRRNRT